MAALTLRNLNGISADEIGALFGPTPIVSGGKTIAILSPIKRPDSALAMRADRARLVAILRQAEALNEGRDTAADDAALEAIGVDPTDWSFDTVRKFLAEECR